MQKQNTLIQELYHKWAGKSASDEEVKELFFLLENENLDAVLTPLLKANWLKENGEYAYTDQQEEDMLTGILAHLPAVLEISAVPAHRVHFLRTIWFRYAAVLLLIAGSAIFLYLNNRPQKQIAQTQSTEKPIILPGGNKAVLTLSDGSRIVLDSAANGSLAQQGDTKIVKLDAGALAYRGGGTANEAILYNTISTPKGGQYQIVLPDGSKVWLNAASSITFPVAFGKDRTVTVTGESYLEIVADKNKPFIVKTRESTIQVLGTSFNVNAYENEQSLNTTLLEGSVKVNGITIKPGQQAQLPGSQHTRQEIKIIDRVDLNKVMAWKNGFFNFDGASLQEVIQQLERWYDIQVTYEKGVPDITFGGKLPRSISLNDLLVILEKSEVHFTLKEGRRLVVTP